MSEVLHDLHAQKLADITHVPYAHILSLRDQGMLNLKEGRNKLIRHDYWQLSKTKLLTHAQIVDRLAETYDVGTSTVLGALRVKIKRIYHCYQCGAELVKRKYINNDGLCDRCYSKRINL